MNQSNDRHEQGLPLSATDRQLWPSLKFIPAERRPVSEPGVVPVRCVEVRVRAAEAGVRAGEPAGSRQGDNGGKRALTPQLQPTLIPPAPAPATPAEIPPAPMAAEAPPRNAGGRPRALSEAKRTALFRLLRQGHTRRDAAKQVGVALSTIRLETRRDVHFALELRHAEVEGQEFRRVFTRLFEPGVVCLEDRPVISTPAFERQKEFLISRGVSREWVSRMRLRTSEEVMDAVRQNEIVCGRRERKGLSGALEKARNGLCGKEIIEVRFSPSGRYSKVMKTTRLLPPSQSVLADRVQSLETLLNSSGPELKAMLESHDKATGCNKAKRRKRRKKPD